MPRTLLLMRHAKSSWSEEGLTDHLRPLNQRGRKDAPRMAQHLADRKLVPQEVFCSTALRAQETLQLMLGVWQAAVRVGFDHDLYLTTAEQYWRKAGSFSPDTSTGLIVGHNPGLGILVERLAPSIDHFPTGAIAVIRGEWREWTELPSSAFDLLTVEFYTPKGI